MTCPGTTCAPSPYESGRLSLGDSQSIRPGGLKLTARAIALANLPSGATVLDLGCGAGDTTLWLSAQGFRTIGIDCATAPAMPAIDGPGAWTRVVGLAEALPFEDHSFDAILAECSFSLFDDRARALAECARVLVDGGRLIISDLYARQPNAIAEVRTIGAPCVAGIWVREELESSLSCAGFVVDAWEDHSRALRECAARLLFEHGSLDGLWGCHGATLAATQSAMRAARAGYFLLIATRRRREKG